MRSYIRPTSTRQARAIASLGTLLVAAAVSVGNYFGNAMYDGVKLGFDQQSWMTWLLPLAVVVGLIVWIAANRAPGWRLSRLPFYRETVSFMIAMTVLLAISGDPYVYLGEALLFIMLYFFYVGLVVVLRYYVPPPCVERTLRPV